MSKMYDVLIVGAGPAGSSSAYYLAKQGIDVLLLDKHDFPREKTCGDALNQRSLSLLNEMNLLDEAVRMGHRCGPVKLIAPRGYSATVPTNYGLIIPRILLDNLLLQEALAYGAQFQSPVRVTDIVCCDGKSVQVRGDYHQQSISFRARIVILAIGANPGLLARMGLLKKMPIMALGARAYFEGITDKMDQAQFYLDGFFPPGYGWILPLSDSSANIGAALLPSKRLRRAGDSAARGAFSVFLRTPELQHMLTGAHRSSPVKGFPVRTDFATAPTFGEHVMLVGEAAGLGHPLTGEGIAFALESGKLAAEHLARMFRTGDFSHKSIQRYDRQLRLRYQLFFSFHKFISSMPFLPYSFAFTQSMNCLVQVLRLAFHLPIASPIAKSLFLHVLGAASKTYPFSPTLLKSREREEEMPVFGERRSETKKEVMLIGRTTPDQNELYYQQEDRNERMSDTLI